MGWSGAGGLSEVLFGDVEDGELALRLGSLRAFLVVGAATRGAARSQRDGDRLCLFQLLPGADDRCALERACPARLLPVRRMVPALAGGTRVDEGAVGW